MASSSETPPPPPEPLTLSGLQAALSSMKMEQVPAAAPRPEEVAAAVPAVAAEEAEEPLDEDTEEKVQAYVRKMESLGDEKLKLALEKVMKNGKGSDFYVDFVVMRFYKKGKVTNEQLEAWKARGAQN